MRLKPIPISLIHRTFFMLRGFNTPYQDTTAWMLYVAFFYLMWPGEYCDKGSPSHPFLMQDV
jgi:hypothetical protein